MMVKEALPGPAGGEQAEDDVIEHFCDRPLGGGFGLQRAGSPGQGRKGSAEARRWRARAGRDGANGGTGPAWAARSTVRWRRAWPPGRRREGSRYRPSAAAMRGASGSAAATDGAAVLPGPAGRFSAMWIRGLPSGRLRQRRVPRFRLACFAFRAARRALNFASHSALSALWAASRTAAFGIHHGFIAGGQPGHLGFDFLLRGRGKIGIHRGHSAPFGLDLLGDAFLLDFEAACSASTRFLGFLLEPGTGRGGLMDALRQVVGGRPGAPSWPAR